MYSCISETQSPLYIYALKYLNYYSMVTLSCQAKWCMMHSVQTLIYHMPVYIKTIQVCLCGAAVDSTSHSWSQAVTTVLVASITLLL